MHSHSIALRQICSISFTTQEKGAGQIITTHSPETCETILGWSPYNNPWFQASGGRREVVIICPDGFCPDGGIPMVTIPSRAPGPDLSNDFLQRSAYDLTLRYVKFNSNQMSNPIIFKSNVFDLSILESWLNSKRSLETMNRCQLNDSNYVNIQNLYSIFKSWCQWKSSLFQQQTSWFEIQHRGTSLPNTLSNTAAWMHHLVVMVHQKMWLRFTLQDHMVIQNPAFIYRWLSQPCQPCSVNPESTCS